MQWYLGEGTLTVTLALSLAVALTELAFASPLARNLGIIVNIRGRTFLTFSNLRMLAFSKKQSIKPTLLAALAAGGGADVLFAASAMSCWCWL